jgi:hypothetical protein
MDAEGIPVGVTDDDLAVWGAGLELAAAAD